MNSLTAYQKPTIVQRVRNWVRSKVLSFIHFEGASKSNRTKDWRTSNGSADAVAYSDLPILRQRSRHLISNNWAAASAVSLLTSRIIGTGIRPRIKGNDELNNLLSRWVNSPTVGTRFGQTFYSRQQLVIRTVIESGACLVVRNWRNRLQMRERGLVLPFQLRILEPDFLNTSIDGSLPNGGHILGGIEHDSTGWVVAYHILKQHPNNGLNAYANPFTLESVRVDASDVAYIYDERRATQELGVPWLAPSMIKIRDLDKYDDGTLVRRQLSTMFAAFVTQMFTAKTPSNEEAEGIELKPGTIQYLEPGEDIKFNEPPTDDDTNFARRTERHIATGIGVTYEGMTGDYSQVNFSSARMGELRFKAIVKQAQSLMIIPQFCCRIEKWFADGARMIGFDTSDAEWTWTPPRQELIDPSREVGAILKAIDGGLSSRTDEIAKLGRDAEEVDKEREQDMKRELQLGLETGSTPSNETTLQMIAD